MRVLLCASALRALDGVGSHLETTASLLLRDGADVHVLLTNRRHERDRSSKTAYLLPKLLSVRGCTLIPPSSAQTIAAGYWDFCLGYSREATDLLGETLPSVPKLIMHLNPRAATQAATYRNTLHLGSTEEVCSYLLKARQMAPERIRLVRVPIDPKRFRNLTPLPESPKKILVVSRRPRMGVVMDYAKSVGARVTLVGKDADDVPLRCFRIRSPWRATKAGAARKRRVEYNIERLMQGSDLVIATGRAAYEAMMCGRPTLFFAPGGPAECMPQDEPSFARLIETNCSGRLLGARICTPERLREELAAYNPQMSSRLRGWVKSRFDAATIVKRITELAGEAIDDA